MTFFRDTDKEPYAMFKAKLEAVAKEMLKISEETLKIDTHNSVRRTLPGPKPKDDYSWWKQTAWGVSTAQALAIKLGVDPWQILEASP